MIIEKSIKIGKKVGLTVKTHTSDNGVPGFKSCLWLLISASCQCRAGEAAGDGSNNWCLPLMWGTWTEFPAPRCSSAQHFSPAVVGIWGGNHGIEGLSRSFK